MTRIWIACATAMLLAGCNDNDYTPDYLPLEVGNYWEFRGVNTSVVDVTEHREVVSTAVLNDKTYFVVVSSYPLGGNANRRDTLYYRKAGNGDVYRRSKDSEEVNIFRLNGHHGDTWEIPFDNNYTISVRLTETAQQVGTKTINNCKAYAIDVMPIIDEEHTITLAPNLGFVREFSDAWGSGRELAKGRIRNSTFEMK